MTDFSKLRSTSGQFEKLQKSLKEASTGKKNYDDNRMWQATQDKAGTGSAIIRFLPACEGEDLVFVKTAKHAFKGPGGAWYYNDCQRHLGLPCPVCEANTELWNSGFEGDKTLARERKRKIKYISNIYVVNDPANKENNGKVFLFEYGASIFAKLESAMSPEFDEPPINPFDLWKGANFKLRIVKKDGYTNYDNSTFDAPSALLDGDEEALNDVWKKQYPLFEFADPSKFKPYAELKARFDVVTKASVTQTSAEDDSLSSLDYEELARQSSARNRPVAPEYTEEELESIASVSGEELSDDLEDIRKLLD